MESSAFSLILCAIRNLQFFTLYQSSSLMTNLIKCEPDTLKMIQNSLDLKNKLFTAVNSLRQVCNHFPLHQITV